jgi:hypothetical protein
VSGAGAGEGRQSRSDEGAAVADEGDADLHLAVSSEPVQRCLNPSDGDRLALWRARGGDDDIVALQAQDGIGGSTEGLDRLSDQ